MKAVYILLSALLAFSARAQSQLGDSAAVSGPNVSEYRDGVYKTVSDFTRKVPTNQYTVIPKGLVGLEKPELHNIPDQCFFFYKFGENPKITDAFAVCYKGNLYFRINAILDHKSKRGRSEAAAFPNSFARVSLQTPDYLYTDVDFANAWAVGAAANMRAHDMYGSARNMAVIWDSEKKVFHIMKFCEDFNEFIAPLKPEFAQQCEKKERVDASYVRTVMKSFGPKE